MATAVYVLCAVASLVCAALLGRAWRRNPIRLLFWSFLCFAMLAVNNALLVADLAVVEGTDLSVWRAGTGFAGLALLLYGLIFDAGRRR